MSVVALCRRMDIGFIWMASYLRVVGLRRWDATAPVPVAAEKNTNAVAAVEIGILAPTALTYPLNRAIVCLLLSGRKIGENVGQRNDYTLHVLIDD